MPDRVQHAEEPEVRPSPRRPEPDAHGQAALLLAESTLHALVEAGVLTRAQASDAIDTAADVKVELADEIGESQGRMRQSLELLHRIGRSMDSKGDPTL